MSDEIRVREEDGFMIFEKDKASDLEIKFYNPAYFSMIGFPDAEISMVNKDTGEPISLESSDANADQVVEDSAEQMEETQETPLDGEVTATGEQEPPAEEQDTQEQEPPLVGDVPATGEQDTQEQEPPLDGEVPAAEEPETPINGEAPVEERQNDNAPTSEIKGGYYENVDELTTPFRNFVYLIQPSSRPLFSKTETTSTNANPTSFGLNSFYDRIKSAFSRNDSKQEESAIQEGDSNVQNASEENNDTNVENVANRTKGMSIMWVVKIPIVGTPETDVNKKQHNVLNAIIREFQANKSNKIIVTGERYSVGNREIKVSKRIESGEPVLDVPESKLIGTKMHKYAKLYQ